MTYDQESKFIRLENDLNGNPRYYVGSIELAVLVGATTGEVAAVAKKVGFKKYRGKRYGGGYVIPSYNLGSDVDYLKETIAATKAQK